MKTLARSLPAYFAGKRRTTFPFAVLSVSLLLGATPLHAQSASTTVRPSNSRSGWEILTPPPPLTPRVNGAAIFGVRPGSPMLYCIPATGQRPIVYSADNLPAGLHVDPSTGIVSGTVSKAGEYPVILRATNALGVSEKTFRIVVGDTIALTPPMGWSSWNCWGESVSQEKVLSSARAMVEKGLRDHGWTYVNIDDGWQGKRGGPLNAIQPNPKFSDMKQLGDALHGMGLKFGIYSTPWRGSYAGFIGGSSDHEDGTYDWVIAGDYNDNFQIGKDAKKDGSKKFANWTYGKYSFADKDAAQWAEWGVDYLKYDWFSNDPQHTDEGVGHQSGESVPCVVGGVGATSG